MDLKHIGKTPTNTVYFEQNTQAIDNDNYVYFCQHAGDIFGLDMAVKCRYNAADFRTQLSWNDLDPDYLRQIIGLAKIEDLAGAGLADRPKQLGDVTTALMPESANCTAQITAREPLIAANGIYLCLRHVSKISSGDKHPYK